MFTLGHISDIHLSLPSPPRLAQLANKRLTGYLNILRRRGASHQDWALEVIVAALKADRPDHVAVTGDLVNLSLKDEFARAGAWLKEHFSPQDTSLVPGNHDAYVPVSERYGLGLWRPYMLGDGAEPDAPAGERWPYLRRRGGLAIIGVTTAIVSAPLLAVGRVGRRQLGRLRQILVETGEEGCCRVVLIHHPPHPAWTHWHKRLLDADALTRVFAETGAELVLHGHNHTETLCFTPGPAKPVPIVGVPSASAVGMFPKPSAQYHLFFVEEAANGWSVEMSTHRLDPMTQEIAATLPRPLQPE